MNFGNFFLVSSLCNVRRDVNRCALLIIRSSWKTFSCGSFSIWDLVRIIIIIIITVTYFTSITDSPGSSRRSCRYLESLRHSCEFLDFLVRFVGMTSKVCQVHEESFFFEIHKLALVVRQEEAETWSEEDAKSWSNSLTGVIYGPAFWRCPWWFLPWNQFAKLTWARFPRTPRKNRMSWRH